jgi:hypothetical protein
MKLINLFEDIEPYETNLDDDDAIYITMRLHRNMLHYEDTTGLSDFKRVARENHASPQDITNILNDNKQFVLDFLAHHNKMLDTRILLHHAEVLHKLGITWPELNDDELLAMAIQEHMNTLGIIDELRKSGYRKVAKVIEKNKTPMLKSILIFFKNGNMPMASMFVKVLERLHIFWPEFDIIKKSIQAEEARQEKEDADNYDRDYDEDNDW